MFVAHLGARALNRQSISAATTAGYEVAMHVTSPNGGRAAVSQPCCAATTKSGNACRMPPLSGTTVCWAHSDDDHVQRQRDDARVAGGATRGLQLVAEGVAPIGDGPPRWWQLKNAVEVRDAYVWLAQRLVRREIDARSANAMAAVLHGLMTVSRDAELEQRIESVERATGVRR
jgi:hypothetical protein